MPVVIFQLAFPSPPHRYSLIGTTEVWCASSHSWSAAEDLTRLDTLLDLMLTNREGLFRDVKVWSSLGHTNHEKVAFKVLRGENRTNNRITALDF